MKPFTFKFEKAYGPVAVKGRFKKEYHIKNTFLTPAMRKMAHIVVRDGIIDVRAFDCMFHCTINLDSCLVINMTTKEVYLL